MIRPIVLSAAAAALVGLAACSSSDKKEAAIACPEIMLPDDADELTRFRAGGGVDLTDVEFQARITGSGLSCSKGEGRETIVDVAIGFEGARGPAATKPSFPLDYFVAVVGPDGQILNREGFRIEMQLPDRRSLGSRTDEIRVTIPVAEGREASDYRLYAGIQLTPDELKYNRDFR